MIVQGTLEHKKSLQKSANIKVLIALAMMLLPIAVIAFDPDGAIAMVAVVLRLLGLVPWFWGLADYSQSKGYSSLMCLLGLCSLIGLIILVLLPDKYVIGPTDAVYDPNSNYPRHPGASQ
jgi:hypothetical protein